MDKEDIILDKQGQAFTLDVMLALVIITIIIGISADAIDIASYKATDYGARFSLERVTNDAADMLIKTPGSPVNWEVDVVGRTRTPGLALVDPRGRAIPNTLSMGKINALRGNYHILMHGRVLPRGLNSSLMIYPSNPSLSPIVIRNASPINATEVAVSNRTVVFRPPSNVEAIIYNNTRGKICPNPGHLPLWWACQYFNISRDALNTRDFYVMTVPIGGDASWIIDRPEIGAFGNETSFSSTPINVTGKISNLLGNDSRGVLWFHVRTPGVRNFDAYVVSVPKGTPQSQVSVNNYPKPWFLILQVWY
ncbi:MAG: hypothetical protein PQ964_03570 [Methanobacteriaceae archaeon]|jgi:hypothetical protein